MTASFAPIPAGLDAATPGVCRLEHLGVIRISGADAAKFIHNQVSQDFVLLGPDQARLAAYCSPQGRMLASLIGLKPAPDEVLLVCSQDLLQATLKRLSMFVLRAQARLSDASSDFALYGVVWAPGSAAGGPAPWSVQHHGPSHAVALYPAQGLARQLWLQPADAAAPQGVSVAPPWWLWSEVMSGVATLTQPVAGQFVPQMLNYESVGGVNFKKGCYPGQEVVARSQFRGTLKRRTFLLHSNAPLATGLAVLDAQSGQEVGTLAQVAAAPAGGSVALGVLQLQLAGQPLCADAVQRPALELLALPYPLLEDI